MSTYNLDHKENIHVSDVMVGPKNVHPIGCISIFLAFLRGESKFEISTLSVNPTLRGVGEGVRCLTLRIAILVFHCLMIVRIDAKAWGVRESNLIVGLMLRVLISNFDSPLRISFPS